MALKRSARSPAAASRAQVSFLLKPASISRQVRSVATRAELPRLPLPSTQTRKLNRVLHLMPDSSPAQSGRRNSAAIAPMGASNSLAPGAPMTGWDYKPEERNQKGKLQPG